MAAIALSRAAELLGASRTAIAGWLADDGHPLAAAEFNGRRGVDSASIAIVLERQRRKHGQELRRIANALMELGVESRAAAGAASPSEEALAQERVGRAAAEARIDELRRALRRANAAVAVLLADPDADVEEVVSRSRPPR